MHIWDVMMRDHWMWWIRRERQNLVARLHRLTCQVLIEHNITAIYTFIYHYFYTDQQEILNIFGKFDSKKFKIWDGCFLKSMTLKIGWIWKFIWKQNQFWYEWSCLKGKNNIMESEPHGFTDTLHSSFPFIEKEPPLQTIF